MAAVAVDEREGHRAERGRHLVGVGPVDGEDEAVGLLVDAGVGEDLADSHDAPLRPVR
jgi:hypothetical protein